MNLGQLEVLVAIVKHGSLTEAADAVGLTQSAVSYSLSRLEAELGVTLLERGRQGVVTTSIGEDVLQHARAILQQLEIIRQKTARERGLAVGKLRLGCVPNVSPRLLTGIIRDFQHQYPDIEIVLFEGDPQELLDWLANDIIDIGTVITPEAFTRTVPLARATIKVLMANDHALAANEYVTMSDIARYPLIGPRVRYSIFNKMLRQQGASPITPRYEVSAYSTIFTMIRENMGLAIMPDGLYEPEMDGIASRPLAPQIELTVHLAATVATPATETFLRNAHSWANDHGFLTDKHD